MCAVAEDVGVDHGRRHVAVAEELLDGADVVTALQQVGGEGVAKGMATGTLVDASRADGAGHGSLHVRLMGVMPALGSLTLSAQGHNWRARAFARWVGAAGPRSRHERGARPPC